MFLNLKSAYVKSLFYITKITYSHPKLMMLLPILLIV